MTHRDASVSGDKRPGGGDAERCYEAYVIGLCDNERTAVRRAVRDRIRRNGRFCQLKTVFQVAVRVARGSRGLKIEKGDRCGRRLRCPIILHELGC